MRQLPTLASGGSSTSRTLEREPARPCSVEGTSSSGRSDALTCSGGNGLTRQGPSGAPALDTRSSREVSEGSTRQSRRQPTKLRGSKATLRESARKAWQPVGPKPALRRQARSCWRSDDRKMVRRRSRKTHRYTRAALQRAISKSNVGGFPTALGGRSPEVMFVMGARGVKRRL